MYLSLINSLDPQIINLYTCSQPYNLTHSILITPIFTTSEFICNTWQQVSKVLSVFFLLLSKMAEKNKDIVLVVSFILSLFFSLNLIGSSSSLPNNGQLVPGMYVFGDSLADVGNNNHLTFSIIKANFPHNGIDFPAKKSTGRFCNGKNAVDLLCKFFLPPLFQ